MPNFSLVCDFSQVFMGTTVLLRLALVSLYFEKQHLDKPSNSVDVLLIPTFIFCAKHHVPSISYLNLIFYRKQNSFHDQNLVNFTHSARRCTLMAVQYVHNYIVWKWSVMRGKKNASHATSNEMHDIPQKQKFCTFVVMLFGNCIVHWKKSR